MFRLIFQFYLIDFVPIFMPISYYTNYCRFALSFEIKMYGFPDFVVLFQYCSGYLGTSPLYYHRNVSISLSIPAKRQLEFDRDWTESVDQLAEYCHVNNTVFQPMSTGCFMFLYFSVYKPYTTFKG